MADTTIPSRLGEIESRWAAAVEYYRRRGGVLFYSESRFWERHGFVQQSLAYALARAGIPVTWLDGSGWRPYYPVVAARGLPLRVRQLPQLPGRRIDGIDALSLKLETELLARELARLGGDPVVWIQSGIDERLAESLRTVDVFSVFDTPDAHSPDGPLCAKARLILCQNSRTVKWFGAQTRAPVKLALPPMDLSSEAFDDRGALSLPKVFPARRCGYLGSFFPDSFDFRLFEALAERMPEWGFVLMGRTDREGEEHLKRLERRGNFLLLPWVPRWRIASVWRYLTVSVLPYRDFHGQDGAFATKAVESFHFGRPVVATPVAKTEDLAPHAILADGVDAFAAAIEQAASWPPAKLAAARDHFEYETHPKLHLARVAEQLSR